MGLGLALFDTLRFPAHRRGDVFKLVDQLRDQVRAINPALVVNGQSHGLVILKLAKPSEINRPCALQPRVNWLAFQGEHGEGAFVHTSKWFLADKPLQALNTQRKFAHGQ